MGNHDLDDSSGHEAWERVHGPMKSAFGHGYTRFVAIHAASRPGRHLGREPPEAVEGPRRDDV